MGKIKTTYTGKILAQGGDPNFDWTPYDDGWDGSKLKVNTKVRVQDPHDKVYCHEAYAQEVYDAMNNVKGVVDTAPKDALKGAVYTVVDIHGVTDHEVLIDTAGGMSAIIDLNKEKDYLATLGCNDVTKFVKAVNISKDFKASLIGSRLLAKVVDHGRVSLWDGQLVKVEEELLSQVAGKTEKLVYKGKIEDANLGGYIVDIKGVKCFMPGSLAAAGVVSDFSALIGKTVPVMVVNYQPNSGFVVSYKEYLATVLPEKIKNEVYVGKQISTRVTGTSMNGIFVQFKDNEGEWIFQGLIHRSVMSKEFEKRFDHREFRYGDQFPAFVNSINEVNGQTRIVISDTAPVKEIEEDE